LGAAFGAAFGFGAAVGAPGAGAGCWACAPLAIKAVASAAEANNAETRPRGQTGAANKRKFIVENPF